MPWARRRYGIPYPLAGSHLCWQNRCERFFQSFPYSHPLLYISLLLIPQGRASAEMTRQFSQKKVRQPAGGRGIYLVLEAGKNCGLFGGTSPSITPLGEMGVGGNPPPLPSAKLCSLLSFSLLNCILFFKDIRIKCMFLFPSIIVFSKKP